MQFINESAETKNKNEFL